MYKFKKIKLENRVILALIVDKTDPVLLNFCTVIRAKYVWQKQILARSQPYTSTELNNLKTIYQKKLVDMIFENDFAMVDIVTGELINPNFIDTNQILEVYEGLLPF